METKINILALSGSSRKKSSTQKALNSLKKFMPNSVEYEIYNGIEKLPHFNRDLDSDKPPVEVQVYRELLSRADGVIICTPEYIKGVPGVLKNALEWLVSSAELYSKPVAVITASCDGENAHQALQLNLSMLNANVFNGGALLISGANNKLNEDGEFIENEVNSSLELLISKLLEEVNKKGSF
ncbi:NAD(P)H-dependent oxidoreductase [Bacillus subtilis]|uniref:NADPH-dependent FMN reductase n=1 Tax=Bacillus subtilis TaxID=1423 RepID=UPI001C2459AF|nr:NAD(P)H-dependent oxidoreductase [Bacillus subtilis]MBU8571580.1 NAD(P)H-dependent oxidoreductase [Bacillus subtilis]MBU8624400.1 NAD(P)H-dependent oxidoreductase [Bacillus subtilis]MCY9210442.1 NAD(P)H-dependent oxidoreductase [Bacillus subtilis]MEC1580317.1 NAD(P)H-dependent oxidoreductase [Bacillus subtilis]